MEVIGIFGKCFQRVAERKAQTHRGIQHSHTQSYPIYTYIQIYAYILYMYIYTCMYVYRLAYAIMEIENSHDLPSAS
jgi:hypothetical protein